MMSSDRPIDESTFKEITARASLGRDYYWKRDYLLAAHAFVQLFEVNPKAWWFALEALRSLRRTPGIQDLSSSNAQILFSPNYAGNSYQNNLYSEQKEFGYEAIPVERLSLDEQLAAFTLTDQSVFHQHWLKELYWRATDLTTGITEIDRHIGILKAIRCFGIPVVWTLHNLIDHDASELQTELCIYAIQKIAEVSDAILLHTERAGSQLSEICGKDLSKKYKLLPHPLYDDLLEKVTPQIPIEINVQSLANRRLLVAAGMIRPYKGIPELIDAFSKLTNKNADHNLHLVIAGHCSDQLVRQKLDKLPTAIRDMISFVPRKLTDAELVGLMNLASVCVTPYRKVLTSGSFYLTTTFRKPTIAPRIGMFAEIMRNNETGFIYDGSVYALASTLAYVSQLSDKELSDVGSAVYNENSEWTVSAASTRLFEILEHLN